MAALASRRPCAIASRLYAASSTGWSRKREGNRPGLAFFGAITARDLDRYLRVRERHHARDLPNLWLAQKGALTGDGVHHAFTRRAAMAGLERHVWPHLMRHTWAHSLKSAGASDEDVMTLGRWRDPKIMLRYGDGLLPPGRQAAPDAFDGGGCRG